MSEFGILLGFCLLILGGVTTVGYIFLHRNSGEATMDRPPTGTLRESLKNFGALVPKRSHHVEHRHAHR